MDKKDIKNKSINELMALLLDKDILKKDKLRIERVFYKKLNNYNDAIDNLKLLKEYFKSLRQMNINIESYLYDADISEYVKKHIINHAFNDEELQALLKKNIVYDLKKHIIKNKFNSSYDVIKILKDNMIDDKLKKLCVKKNINNYNIISVLLENTIDDECREYILSTEKRRFVRVLYSTSNKELIYRLTFDFSKNGDCLNNVDFIQKYKPSLLKNLSRAINCRYIRDLYDKTFKNEMLIGIVLDRNEQKINKVINNVRKEECIRFLEVKDLPKEYVQVIINNNINYLNDYIDKLSVSAVIRKLYNYKNINLEFKKMIVNRRCDDLINELNRYDLKKYLDYVNYHYYNDKLIVNTIDNKIIGEEIFSVLNAHTYDNNIIDFIVKYKDDYIKEILSNIDWDNLIYNKKNNDRYIDIITSLTNNVQDKIYKKNNKYIKNILSKYDSDTLNKFLSNSNITSSKFIRTVQNVIFKIFDVSDEKINYCSIIIKYSNGRNIFELLRNIEEFFNKIEMDISLFFQYGSYEFGNKLIDNIIEINNNNNEINDFINVKKYLFDNYFDNTLNNATMIINLNLVIKNYNLYKNLLLDISNKKCILNDNDKSNLYLLFSGKFAGTPLTLYELDEIRKKEFNKYRVEILDKNTYINRIKDIFFNNIITYNRDYFDSIGNISLLKILQKDNIDNKEIFYLIEEIITSMDIINKLATTNDRDELVKIIISYIDGEDTPVNRMINDIINIKSKIRRLYELDSMYNLTTLESARKVPGIYNKEYMELYGGEVFDFSDKNYVLYAHVVSSRENIEDLVNGYSSGNSNFISFSPISYRGQKYYYDYCDCILAYDTIYDNSFICSSLSNMGSNYCMVEKNSAVVADKYRNQRGILETSSVKKQNAETLLYREGLKPCGIILANGKRPNSDEIMYHKRYNLPFIITQKKETAIDNPKRVFTSGNGKYVSDSRVKELDSIKKYIDSKLTIKKENDIYTGREVAIFTDTHAMYEPTIAILEDIRFRGISEIYSLGDNTSLGPNPREVLDLMDKYNVNQIMGNSEYYLTLGGSPFNYWNEERERSLDWTNDRVQGYINDLKLYKPSLDLLLGGKKIALCHFGNDIRWDFVKHNTWIYQDNIGNGKSADQFMFTNGDEYNKEVEYMINKYGIDNPKVQGYLSSKNTPMFDGKLITSYDDVFQGHVHFELEDRLNNTNIHTLRGAGMGELDESKKSMAYYVILKEKKIGGYDIEKVYVPFNKNSLLSSIYSSDMPTKAKILSYLK